jgi:hypothetical protein
MKIGRQGRRLNEMLEMGLSKSWLDALFVLTGQREMDATAIRDYFAPLQAWLYEQNRRERSGLNQRAQRARKDKRRRALYRYREAFL